MSLTDVVWQDWRYEAGSYDCRVTRSGDLGRLTIVLTTPDVPCLVHEQLVELTDRRPDTEQWRERCVDVIRHPNLRSVET